MNFYKIILVIGVTLITQTLHSQTLFVESSDWGNNIEQLIPDSLQFELVSSVDSIKNGDTVRIEIVYPTQQLAIEGQTVCAKDKLVKIGIWKYYYQSGELWSEREYKKKGKLTSILKLLSKNGQDLEVGYARPVGRHKYLSGYNYIYDENSKISSIGEYGGGKLTREFPKDKYNKEQLSRLKIRIFELTEPGTYLEELSFEEAFEKQKQTNKTILLNASTRWNGWTRRGYSQTFKIKNVVDYINENFILAYLDIEDTKPIELEIDGEITTLNGALNRRYHELISRTIKNITSTPTFIYIGSDLEVLHKSIGIELKEEKFMNVLKHFTSGKYKTMSLKDFEKN